MCVESRRLIRHSAYLNPGKHRKVRCHFASDEDRSCRECLVRGLLCRTQDLPKPENPRESDRASLNDRLARVELILERILQRYDGDTDPSFSGAAGDDNCPVSSLTAATPAHENAPVLSLFDNEVVRSMYCTFYTFYRALNIE